LQKPLKRLRLDPLSTAQIGCDLPDQLLRVSAREIESRLRQVPLPAGKHKQKQRSDEPDPSAPRGASVGGSERLRVAYPPFLFLALAFEPRQPLALKLLLASAARMQIVDAVR
jgi:hypothetical protein